MGRPGAIKMMTTIATTLQDAIDACEAHCNGARRDASLSNQFDKQVEMFGRVLQKMLANMEKR
jgi:hypothetical protein